MVHRAEGSVAVDVLLEQMEKSLFCSFSQVGSLWLTTEDLQVAREREMVSAIASYLLPLQTSITDLYA